MKMGGMSKEEQQNPIDISGKEMPNINTYFYNRQSSKNRNKTKIMPQQFHCMLHYKFEY